MILSNSHKAILITIFISTSVVLMAFGFHIKKQNELVAETFFEILPEDTYLEEETEDLEDILESLDDVLSTNQAFNQNKNYDDYEDQEFQETMDRLKSRHENDDEIARAEDFDPLTNDRDNTSLKEINDIIKKRSNNTANKNSTISFSLLNRDKIYIPPPIYLCEYGGIMVVNITVNKQGNVIDAVINATASSSTNGCLVDRALEYAKASEFTPDSSKETQIGTITFIFKGKS